MLDNYKNSKLSSQKNLNSKGFSMVELLIVLAIISIMSGVALFYLGSHENLYTADNQALKIADILQEARQRSLTQRETMRVEVDLTDNTVRLIDENGTSSESDDVELKSIVLPNTSELRVDQKPTQILNNPPEPFPAPTAVYKQSVYTPSLLHDVCTIRFMSNGQVFDAGNNPTGSGATATGVTLHVWSPSAEDADQSHVARALTVIGSTGTIRLWEYDENLSTTNKWKDSRRTSIFGGQSGGGNSNSN